MDLEAIKRARETRKSGSLVSASNGIKELKSTLISKRSEIENRIAVRSSQVISQVSSLLKDNDTEIVAIFDCSGSVEGTERVTVESYINMLNRELRKGYKTTVSTILFNDKDHVIHDRVDIKNVEKFNYTAVGGTKFFDTFCYHMKKIKSIHDKLPQSERPRKKLVVIMTDGGDNKSIRNGIIETNNLIETLKEDGWEFIYLCADKKLINVARAIGIKSSNIEMYLTDGIKHNFEAVSRALDDMHLLGEITPEWSKPIKTSKLMLTDGNDKPNIYRLK